ncbi:cyanophycin synthetase [Clostridium amylolyticum]|uniref:Cyanophycin synthetase n=1 Tax=Clostridium amylolyticum TaxID=1121298 RepID=A0A1M6B6V6_9CLOT|nr:cyanophycin synthetase [Clostridium amylolyticum]SHI44318.1 cyanophycin synthetase [Clostridium amylolyticum]
MKILDYRIYEGRNIYSHRKCVKLTLDLEGYKDISSNMIPNFNYNILKLLPELKEHHCGIYKEGGFVIRLNEGTYLAHICEHVIIALHNRLNMDVSFGKAREIKGDIYYVIFQYYYKNTALAIANFAVDIVNSLVAQNPIEFKSRLEHIKQIMNNEAMGPSTEAICKAAEKRGIPILSVGDSGLYQLGYGKKGRIIEASISPFTSCIGADISCDKLLTKIILKQQCIPVPNGYKVNNSIELIQLAEDIGYPVVLKPQFGSKGNGVMINIKKKVELIKKYTILKNDFKDIIIEKYYRGNDYRVCVVDYKVSAVSRRIPPYIIGDGKSTIKELITRLNEDELRGEDHEKPLTKIKIDDSLIDCLSKNNYNLTSIIKSKEKLILRNNANLSTGGMAIDCTEEICEENIETCVRAAKALGLDICGIDICCDDISVPLSEQEGVIIEVNAAPGIRMHHYPTVGKERNVAGDIVDMIFKNSKENIPLVSVTGTNGKTTTTRLIYHTLSIMGYTVGMTTTGGIYIGKKCIDKGDTTGVESAKTVLFNKDVEVAVLETARGGIIRNGLAYDMADVGIITNITADHLGIDDINSLEELAYVKSLVVEAVKDNGYAVLNSEDYWSMQMINRVKSNKIFFGKDRENNYLLKNLNDGGYGIYLKDNIICVEKDDKVYKICSVDEIPITLKGRLKHNIENAMAACGALVGLEVDYCMIRKGLMSFRGNEEDNPGRFNIHDFNNYTVVLDYGHNIEGYKAVLSSIKEIPHNRLIGIIGIPGDRLNDDVYEVGRISSEYLDYIYIKEDEDKRGRKKGEIANLLEKGILQNNYKSNRCEIVLDEVEALNKAMVKALPGDLIIIFFENYDRVIKFIKNNKIALNKENII